MVLPGNICPAFFLLGEGDANVDKFVEAFGFETGLFADPEECWETVGVCSYADGGVAGCAPGA